MPNSLAEEMDDIARWSVEDSLGKDIECQKFYMVKPNDEHIVALLSVGPGSEIARVARQLVFVEEPVIAVLVTEGWTVKAKPDEADPDRLAVMRGQKKPSDLPMSKRDETLILYGESASGEHAVRMWDIINRNGIRDLAEITEPMTGFETRFHPLFVIEDLERTIQNDMIEDKGNSLGLPADALAAIRKLTKELTPEERHRTLRKVYGQMLALGGGTTSRAWENVQRARRKR